LTRCECFSYVWALCRIIKFHQGHVAHKKVKHDNSNSYNYRNMFRMLAAQIAPVARTFTSDATKDCVHLYIVVVSLSPFCIFGNIWLLFNFGNCCDGCFRDGKRSARIAVHSGNTSSWKKMTNNGSIMIQYTVTYVMHDTKWKNVKKGILKMMNLDINNASTSTIFFVYKESSRTSTVHKKLFCFLVLWNLQIILVFIFSFFWSNSLKRSGLTVKKSRHGDYWKDQSSGRIAIALHHVLCYSQNAAYLFFFSVI